MTQDRTRLRELFDELHSVGKQCDDPNLRTLIVGAATVLIAQDDERAALLDERDALVRALELAKVRASKAYIETGLDMARETANEVCLENESLKAERDALAADARRYRVLCETHPGLLCFMGRDCYDKAEFDAAIDEYAALDGAKGAT
jgi:hypothetical protein